MDSSQTTVADNESSDQLLAAAGKGRQIKVNQLREPDLDLNFSLNQKTGQLEVTLKVPVSSGDASQVPLLQVTRDPVVYQKLLNQAQDALTDKYAATASPIKVGAEVEGKFQVFSFKLNVGHDFDVNGKDYKELKSQIQKQFDETRQDFYRERAVKWTTEGGAAVPHGKDVYKVSDQASLDYLKFSDQRYNQQHPNGAHRGLETSILETLVKQRQNTRSDADIDSPTAVLAANDRSAQRNPTAQTTNALDDPKHGLHKLYGEILGGVKALEGTPAIAATNASDKDIAVALLQEALNRGAKPNSSEQTSVMPSKDGGLIAVQGALDHPGSPSGKIILGDVQANAATAVADKLTQQLAAQTIAVDVPQLAQQKSHNVG